MAEEQLVDILEGLVDHQAITYNRYLRKISNEIESQSQIGVRQIALVDDRQARQNQRVVKSGQGMDYIPRQGLANR